MRSCAEAASAAGIESVVVTSSKIKGDIQTVPIAITALSQEQLTSRQIAGGPDLVKEVPNLTFSKTNFTGYNIQIRGIGTQAISVTTDPAVAVAFNDTPFIRNHFFEQEFYDVSAGRSAARAARNALRPQCDGGRGECRFRQADRSIRSDGSPPISGNYHNRRFEGMINIPIVDDRLDLRVAGEWTKRDGYTLQRDHRAARSMAAICGRRASRSAGSRSKICRPISSGNISPENDDRLRTGKQLCKTDPGLSGRKMV